MYIFTITLTKAKASALTAVFLLGVLVLIYIIPAFSGFKTVSTNEKYFIRNTEKGRQDFINSLGWKVLAKPFAVEKLTVPTEFDKLYSDYNELQRTQGLDLSSLKGEKLQKYTYKVTNYEDKSLIVYINIFIYKGKVVAGDINSPDFKNGFIRNFLNIEEL